MDNHFIIYTDGGSRGNPGPSAIGVIIISDNKIIMNYGKRIKNGTNNEAEYKAILDAFCTILDIDSIELNKISIEIRADSQLAVRQLNGEYKVSSKNIIPLYDKIKEIIKDFKSVKFTHIPRDKNKLADAELNITLDSKF